MNDSYKKCEHSRHDYRITELDSDLLSTPFRIKTNWHVITGAICCGKTTLINMLAQEGFHTVPEVSRVYIENEVAKGRALDEIFGSRADERVITQMQCSVECGVKATDVAFLDRALPDFLWFWRLLGMNPNELLAKCFLHRYASVFILDQLPLQLDGARIDDELYTDRFDDCLVHDYCALGYQPVRVPVLPPEDRLEFVLERLLDQGLL